MDTLNTGKKGTEAYLIGLQNRGKLTEENVIALRQHFTSEKEVCAFLKELDEEEVDLNEKVRDLLKGKIEEYNTIIQNAKKCVQVTLEKKANAQNIKITISKGQE